MSADRSLSASFLIGIAAAIAAAAWFAFLVLLELIAAIVVYSYLATYQRDLFGSLAKQSSDVLNMLVVQIGDFTPGLTNAAYATLLGELAPKAFLLLLIGLIVGAILRFIFWMLGRLTGIHSLF